MAAGELVNVGVDETGAAVYVDTRNLPSMLREGVAVRETTPDGETFYTLTDAGRAGFALPMTDGEFLVLSVFETASRATYFDLRRAARDLRTSLKSRPRDRRGVQTAALLYSLGDALEECASRVNDATVTLELMPVTLALEAVRRATTVVTFDFSLDRWLAARAAGGRMSPAR